MGLAQVRNSWTRRFVITTTNAELLWVKKVCEVNFIFGSQIGCQVPCLKVSFTEVARNSVES